MQLPAFCLSPQLADRQQDSPANLKPSEVRLSRQRSDPPGEPGDVNPHRDSEPALRGILKKSCSGAWEGSGTDAGQTAAASSRDQNGGGCEEGMEKQVLQLPPRRPRRAAAGGEGGPLWAAPWRQRARASRETVAGPPVRGPEEQDAPQDRRDKDLEQLRSPVQLKRAAG